MADVTGSRGNGLYDGVQADAGANVLDRSKALASKYGWKPVIVPAEQEAVTRLVSQSESPMEDAYSYNSAIAFSQYYDIPLPDAMRTLPALYEAQVGRKYEPNASAWESIVNSFTVGSRTVDLQKRKNEWEKAVMAGDSVRAATLEGEIRDEEEYLSSLVDYAPRSWVTKALQWTANTLPYTLETSLGAGAAGFAVGAAAAAATGLGLPAIIAAGTVARYATKAATFGITEPLFEGDTYWDLMHQEVVGADGQSHHVDIDKNIAAGLARWDGIFNAAIESELGIGSKFAGMISGSVLSAAIKDTVGSMMATGVANRILLRIGRAVMDGAGEAAQEGMEELVDTGARSLAYKLSGYAPRDTVEETAKRALTAAGQAWVSSMIMGVPVNVAVGTADVKQASRMVSDAKGDSRSVFVSKYLGEKPEGISYTKQYEILNNMYDRYHKDESGVAAKQESFHRLSNGGLYSTEEIVSPKNGEGVEERRFLIGDPEIQDGKRGSQYGAIDFELSDNGNRLTITDVSMGKGHEDLAVEAVTDLIDEYPKATVEWDTNGNRQLEAIKAKLMETNGSLQFNSPDQTQGHQKVVNAISRAFGGSLNNKQLYTAADVLEVMAQTKGMTGEQYLAKYFANGGFRKLSSAEGQAVLRQSGLSEGDVNGLTQFVTDGKAIVYAAEHGNFSTFVHESFHVLERVTDSTQQLEDAVRDAGRSGKLAEYVKAHDRLFSDGLFTTDDEGNLVEASKRITDVVATWGDGKELSKAQQEIRSEIMARLFEGYLYDGKTFSPKLQTIFAKIAQWMRRIYRGMQTHGVTLTDDIIRAYDDLLTRKDSGVARAEREGVLAQAAKIPSMAEVRRKNEGTDQWMKAPNGEQTNLTERQWLQVRTPQFKKWFGDWENDPEHASKVVDENGEPLVVYHGSDSNFDIFDRTKSRINMDIQGNFFSPWELDASGYGGNIKAFFLNLRNPSNESTGYKALNKYKGQNGAGIKAREYLQDLGFDGVNNSNEEYIAFESNQIKSATDNNGAFDSDNPSILAQAAYHGSAYLFDKFKTDKVNSGEGSQSFGWGLYFTQSKHIAAEYAKRQGDLKFKDGGRVAGLPDLLSVMGGSESLKKFEDTVDRISGKPGRWKEVLDNFCVGIGVSDNDIPQAIDYASFETRPEGNTFKEMMASRSSGLTDKENAVKAALEDFLNTEEGLRFYDLSHTWGRRPHYVYSVELPDGKYLDWNAPMPEEDRQLIRSRFLQESGESLPDEIEGDPELDRPDNHFETGRDFYRGLREMPYFRGEARDVSGFLHRLGYKGIVYDAGSIHGGGDGARNLVVFDENDIRITGKTLFQRVTAEQAEGVASIRKHYESYKSVLGNEKTIYVGDEKLKGHWKLVEAEAPMASHDERTFQQTPGFPIDGNGSTVNDRDYGHDIDARNMVVEIASHFDGRALDTGEPVVVTKDGIVVSGNNRTMSSKLAARNGTDQAYVADLKEQIKDFGLSAEDLDGFKHPRIIFEIDEEHQDAYTTEEFAKYNKTGKKAKNVTEKAVEISKTITPEAVGRIAGVMAGYDTMSDMWADQKACRDIMKAFVEGGVIGRNEVPQYYTEAAGMSAAGKEFVETCLVGSIMNEDNIRTLAGDGAKSIRQKLVKAIVPLLSNLSDGSEYTFNAELNEAVGIAAFVAKNRDQFPTVRLFLSQQDMFGKQPGEITKKLAVILDTDTQKEFADRMRNLEAALAPNAKGEIDLFLGGVESRDVVIGRAIDSIDLTPSQEEQELAKKAAAKKKRNPDPAVTDQAAARARAIQKARTRDVEKVEREARKALIRTVGDETRLMDIARFCQSFEEFRDKVSDEFVRGQERIPRMSLDDFARTTWDYMRMLDGGDLYGDHELSEAARDAESAEAFKDWLTENRPDLEESLSKGNDLTLEAWLRALYQEANGTAEGNEQEATNATAILTEERRKRREKSLDNRFSDLVDTDEGLGKVIAAFQDDEGQLPPEARIIVDAASREELDTARAALKRDPRLYRTLYAERSGEESWKSGDIQGEMPQIGDSVGRMRYVMGQSERRRRLSAKRIANKRLADAVSSGDMKYLNGITDEILKKAQEEIARLEEQVVRERKQGKTDADQAVRDLKRQISEREAEKREARRQRQYMQGLADFITRPVPKNVDIDTALEIQMLVEKSGIDPNFRNGRAKFQGKMQSVDEIRQWLEDNGGMDAHSAEISATLFDKLTKKPLNEWTVSDLEDMASYVWALEEHGRQVYLQKQVGQQLARRGIQAGLIQTLKDSGRTPDTDLTITDESKASGRRQRNRQTMMLETVNPEHAMKLLDNMKDNGAFFQEFLQKKRNAQDVEWENKAKRITAVLDQLAAFGYKLDDLNRTVQYGDKHISVAELAFAELAKRNEETRQAYAYGLLVGKTEKDEILASRRGLYETKAEMMQAVNKEIEKLGQQRYGDILTLAEKELTDNDRKAMEIISKDLGGQIGRINEVAHSVYNMHVDGVQAYLPHFRMDIGGTEPNAHQQMAEMMNAEASIEADTGVFKGFTQKRIKISPYNQTPIQSNLVDVWRKSLDATEHFIAFSALNQEWNAVARGFSGRSLVGALQSYRGKAYADYLSDYMNEVVTPKRMMQGDSRLVKALRGNLPAAYLAFKPSGVVLQMITSPAAFLKELNPAEYLAAVGQWMTDMKGMDEFIFARSPFMRQRQGVISHAISDTIANDPSMPAWQRKMSHVTSVGMMGMEFADHSAVHPGWIALYRRKLRELGGIETQETMAEAAQYADNIVHTTQPVSDRTEMAPLFKKGGAMGVLTQFSASMNVIWNNITVDAVGLAKEVGDKALPTEVRMQAFRRLVGQTMGYALAGLVLGAVQQGFKGKKDDDDDTGKKVRRGIYYATTQFTGATPLVSDFVDWTVEKVLTGESAYMGGDSYYPALTAMQRAMAAKTPAKQVENALRALGLATGMPVSGISQAVRAVEEKSLLPFLGR